MKKINIKGLDKIVFHEVLDNGLNIYVIPYNNKNNYSVSYVVKYGSNYTNFIPSGEEEYVKVPDGIAHFLEHKMFETEHGMDPFTFYSKSGTNCNAYTDFTETAYIFQGTESFKENLNYLLDYVNSPYFTDENVEKEKGIIAEELNMFKDDPNNTLFNLTRSATYINDPYIVDIGGSVEAIKTITKEDLYKCYNSFYTPSNMYLLVTGNVNPNDVINIAKENSTLSKRTNTNIGKIKPFIEPANVKTSFIEKELDIVNTKIGYTIKTKLPKNIDLFKYNVTLGLLLDALFGPSSLFKEEARHKKLMTNISVYRDITKDYLSFLFLGESDKPKELIELINKTFKDGIFDESTINRIKKVWISGEVMGIDDINVAIRSLEDDLILYNKYIPNKCDVIRSITYDEVKEIYNKLDLSNTSTVILKPKEK